MTTPLQGEYEQELTDLQKQYEMEVGTIEEPSSGIPQAIGRGLLTGAKEAVTGLPHFVGEVATAAGKFTAGTFAPLPLETRMRYLKESAEFPLEVAKAMFVTPPHNVYKVWQGLRSGQMSDEEALGILEETAAGAGMVLGGIGIGKATGKLLSRKGQEAPRAPERPVEPPPGEAAPQSGADIVNLLAKAEAESAARLAAVKKARTEAGSTWALLTPDLRRELFKGMSEQQYLTGRFKDLPQDAQEVILRRLADQHTDSPLNKPGELPGEAPAPTPAPAGPPAVTAPPETPSVPPALSREQALRERLSKNPEFVKGTPEQQEAMIRDIMAKTDAGLKKALDEPMSKERAQKIAADINKQQEGTVGHIEPDFQANKEGRVAPRTAVGYPAGEDVYNPGRLDASGNPELIVRKGEKITPEAAKTMEEFGIEGVIAGRVTEGKVVGEIKPAKTPPPIPDGDPYATSGQPGYIPTVRAIAWAKKAIGAREFNNLVKSKVKEGDSQTTQALIVEQEARRAMQLASGKPAPTEPVPAPEPAAGAEPGPSSVSRGAPAEPSPATEPRPALPPARTPAQIQFELEQLADDFDAGKITGEELGKRQSELLEERKKLAKPTKKADEPARPIADTRTTKPSKELKEAKKLEARYKELTAKTVKQLTDEELNELRQMLQNRLANEGGATLSPAVNERLNRVIAELGRRKTFWGNEGGYLRLHRRQVRIREDSELQPYERILREKLKSDYVPPTTFGLKDHILSSYMNLVREAVGVGSREKKMLRGRRIETWQSPYKLAQMLDRATQQAMAFLVGDGPAIPDGAGGFIRTGGRSFQKILNDMEKLRTVDYWDMLWGSLHELETRALSGGKKSIGLDPVAAQQMVANATPEEIILVREAVAYNRALAQYGVAMGQLSAESFAKFNTEFYAPKSRIFEPSGDGGITDLTSSGKTTISSDTPFKRASGSVRPMRGFIESTIDMTHRVIRRSNLNDVGQRLIKIAKQDLEAARGIMEPAEHWLKAKIKEEMKAKAEEYRKTAADAGVEITLEEATLKVDTDAKGLNVTDGILRAYVDGQLEVWRVDPILARSLGSLRAPDIGMLWRLMGLPAKAVHFGITNDPIFIMNMAFVDQFQGFINSKYGFIPGISGLRGYVNIIRNSPRYREFLQGGGAGLARTYGRIGGREAQELQLRDVARPAQSSLLGEAAQQIKEGRYYEAYKTLVNPIEQATRVGEYLLARDHGASVMDAIYAAKEITINYHNVGAEMHGLAHATPFLNAGIQNLDKIGRNLYERPGAYAIKGGLAALMSYYLWMSQQDDQEIQDLRQTKEGARYWYIRDWDGGIWKLRKPYFEGAVYGSGVEAVLDKMKNDDPEAVKLWAKSVLSEIAIGAAPPPLAAGYALATGVDARTGIPLVPEGMSDKDPSLQFTPYSGKTSRELGALLGISPAKIEYAIGALSGRLGTAVLKTIDTAAEWKQHGELPPKDELPLISQIAVRSPKTNVRPLREFYDYAMKAEEVGNSIAWLTEHDPERLSDYVERNKESIMLLAVMTKPRKEIAELRRAMMDLHEAPIETISIAEKREYTDHFLRAMIEIARATNIAAQNVRATMAAPTAR